VVGAGSVRTVRTMRTVDRLETRVLTLDPRVVDAAVAVAFGVITVIFVGLQKHPSVVEVLAGVVLSATVAGRRRAPVLAVVVAGVAATLVSNSGGGQLAISPVVLVCCTTMTSRAPALTRSLATSHPFRVRLRRPQRQQSQWWARDPRHSR